MDTSPIGTRRFTAASRVIRLAHSTGGSHDYEACGDSPAFTRPALPLARHHRMEQQLLRLLPWASHPAATRGARQGGDGPMDTGPGHVFNNGTSRQLTTHNGEVDPGRPAGVAIGGFPRVASRTRRAPLSAPGAPQAPEGPGVHLMLCSATVSRSLFPGSSSAVR